MNNNKHKLGKIAAVTAVAAMGFGGFFLNPEEFSKAYAADIQVLSTDVKVDPEITNVFDGTKVTNFSIDGIGEIDPEKGLSYEQYTFLYYKGETKIHTTIENNSTQDAYLYAKASWDSYDFNTDVYPDVPEKIIVKSGEKVEITMNANFSKSEYLGNIYIYFGDENESGYYDFKLTQIKSEENKYGPEKYFDERNPAEVNENGITYYEQGDSNYFPEYEDSYYSIFYYTSPFKEGEEPDPRYGQDAGQFKVIGIKKDSDGTIKTADGKDTLEVNIFKNDGINSFPIGKQDPRFSVDESKVKEFGSNYLGTYTFSQDELQNFYDLIVNQKYYGSGRKPNQEQLSNLIKDGEELVLLGEAKERENDLALVRGNILQSVIIENLDMESSTIGFIGISYNRNATIYSTTPASPMVGMRAYIDDKNPDDPIGITDDKQSSDANDLIPELKEGTYKVSYDFKNTGIVPITNVVLKDGDGKVVKDYGDRVFQPQDREVFTTDVSISENFKKNLTVEAKSIYNDEKATYSDPIGANVTQLPRAIDLTTFIKDNDGEWKDANDSDDPVVFDKSGTKDVQLSIKNTGEGDLVNPVVTLPDGTTKTLENVTIKSGETYNWNTTIDVERGKSISADYSVTANGVSDSDPINATVSEDSRIPEASPDSAKTDFNTPVTLSPLENDALVDNGSEWKSVELLDKDGSPVKKLEVDEGTFVVNDDNTVTFTPKDDFSGEVPAVNYRATDSDDKTAESTITITVGEKPSDAEVPPVDENGNTDESTEPADEPSDESIDPTENSSDETSDNSSEESSDSSEEQPNDENTKSPSDPELPNASENSTGPQVKNSSVNDNQSNNKEKVENIPLSFNSDNTQKNETFEKNSRIPETSKNIKENSGKQNSNDSASVKTGGETVENDSKAGVIAGAIAGIGAIIASAVALTNRKSKENKTSKNSKN